MAARSLRPFGAAALLVLIPMLGGGVAAAKPGTLPPAGHGQRIPVVESSRLPIQARTVARGASLRLVGVEVPATSETLAFDLRRFDVFAPDAVVIIHETNVERRVAPPRNVYFRGTVVGEPESRVFLDVHEDGVTRGIVDRRGDAIYLIDSAAEPMPSGPLVAERVDPVLLKGRGEEWRCGVDQLSSREPAAGIDLAQPAAFDRAIGAPPTAPPNKALFTHTVRVAIETDYEFLHLPAFGGSEATATTYIGDLFGYASTVYQSEISADLQVPSISFWDLANDTLDPWIQTSSLCGLVEFGNYWNVNNVGVSRTIAHFLAGRGSSSGIAWLGVLCSGAFDSALAGITTATCPTVTPPTSTWGGAFGYTGGLFGTFDIDTPTIMWDLAGVMHEIGHNFNSPHSHCYKNLGGNASEIDGCYGIELPTSACHSGTVSLPGPGTLSGSGDGTIMSYCHLRPGGYSNITLSFGRGVSDGVAAWREAERMSDHVLAKAIASPSCLANPATWLLVNGFEEGTLLGPVGAWSGKTP